MSTVPIKLASALMTKEIVQRISTLITTMMVNKWSYTWITVSFIDSRWNCLEKNEFTEEKSSSASKRILEKVVKSSQVGTSHSLSDKSSDSLGLGTRFLTLNFMKSSASVFRMVSRYSSPILRESSGSTVGKLNAIAIAGKG
nr:hypothetical protein [Tanacetum cinerariifolium]